MRIAVLGTGRVGRTLAAKLLELGHEVRMGTRDPEATLTSGEPDPLRRTQTFAEWYAEHHGVELVPMDGAAEGAELVVNATLGTASVAALEAAGVPGVPGIVVMDVANPLVAEHGSVSLFIGTTDSLGERIQLRFPQARVVKTLNTVNSTVMTSPLSLARGEHTMFVAGDDADAKRLVTGLLGSFGWTDVLDLGGIEAARGMESYLLLWIQTCGALGTPGFSIRVVRPD